MEKKFSFYNNLIGWLVFIGASIVYLLTMEPTVSLWDCGEFIATAAKLEVGHPPGAPLFLMLGRFFALFAGDDVTLIAKCINSLSALSSGATIMFLFWTITHLAKKYFLAKDFSFAGFISILGAGLIGAAAYAFSDTFWFSAVEGEVYALSSLFTAVVFWAMLKWENVAHTKHADKWIILIAYIMGLSIGVHLLNLLTITAIVYIYYFKKYKPTTKGIILVGLLSVILIAFMMWGVIVGSIEVAAQFELFFVNTLGLPFQSGFISYFIILIAALVAGMILTRKNTKVKIQTAIVTLITVLVGMPFISSNSFMWLIITAGIAGLVYYMASKDKFALNTVVNAIAVIMMGYSSYAMIVIRSNAETPMNENAPNNAFSLLSYLNREQYGDSPLFYGQYYNARPQWEETADGNKRPAVEKKTTYTPRGEKYVEVNNGMSYKWASEFSTIFPRMHSSEEHHIRAYKEWADIRDGENTNDIVYEPEEQYNGGKYSVPTFGQNLTFFFSYQVNHMYLRYFMWNFAGRQNDVQSHGGLVNGNWITGIDFIDNARLGDQTEISEKAKNDPTRNEYYLLPFILGLIGMYFHFKTRTQDSIIVLLLFLLTGLAIVVFLNQTPYQPRERDYAYAGSFYAFCIWIGLSVIALYHFAKKYIGNSKVAAALGFLIAVPTPIILGTENWDDHDRSNRYTALEFARNYLETCAPNSIIITAGDNDTFPLWYAQEVEGIRTDVRVVCSPLLSTDWYSQQMMRKTYESEPLPTKLTHDQVAKGIRDHVEINEGAIKIPEGSALSLEQAMEVVRNDKYSFFPAKTLFIPIDKKQVLASGIIAEKDSAKIASEIVFSLSGEAIYKNKLIIYDVLDGYKWDRPIYFTNRSSAEDYGLQNYVRYDGLAYKLVPIYNPQPQYPEIDIDVLYDNVVNKYNWGGMGDSTVHMGHFNQRQISVMGIREMHNQLAISLIAENKIDSAKVVLKKLKSILPDSQFPYMDRSVNNTVYAYYRVGEDEEARTEMMTLFKNLVDELEWIIDISENDEEFSERLYQDYYQYNAYAIIAGEFAMQQGDQKLIQQIEAEWMRVSPGMTMAQTIEAKRRAEMEERQRRAEAEQARKLQQQQQEAAQQNFQLPQ